jgi:hypothetical protein
MADRWMDERDRAWRERDWRRSETFDRDPGRAGEDRSWSRGAERDEDDRGGYGEAAPRWREAPEEDYGSRSEVTHGGAYGVGAGRASRDRFGGGGERLRIQPQDYTDRQSGYSRSGGGMREPDAYDLRRDYGPAGRAMRGPQDYGDDRAFQRHGDEWRRQGPGGPDRSREFADRGHAHRAHPDHAHAERDRGEGASDFLSRAGEKITSWFRGDNLMRGSHDDGQPHRYQEDFGREARSIPDPGLRGRGPRGYRRSDERINDEVHDRLTDDPWLDASHIEVAVKDGEVTLSGHVDNREAKHRAERLVEDLSGVRHVQNNLRVEPSAGQTGAGRGFGSSALEAEMQRNSAAVDPSNNGASGLSGRTSTGALSERSAGSKTDAPRGGGAV